MELALISCLPYFFLADDIVNNRARVNPGDRCEYEYEFTEGKRKSPRVLIVGGGDDNAPPPPQRRDSRGAHGAPILVLPSPRPNPFRVT